jgi:hypothetical protein
MAEEPSDRVDDDIRHDDLTLKRLRECLSYDADTGVLRWKTKPSKNVAAGDIAGCRDHRGYWLVRLDRQLLLGHRVAWALHHGEWPERDLDHINADKSDNRLVNLRLATRTQNIANAPAYNRNGMPKGCYQLKGRRRWYSRIRIDGKYKQLGTFATAQEAAEAFEREHRAAHGDFSRCEAR